MATLAAEAAAGPRPKFWLLLTASLVSSLIMLDSNIVAVSLPAIGRSLGAFEGVGQHGQRRRQEEGPADALGGARQVEHQRPGRQPAGGRGYGEDRQADQHGAPAAPQVGVVPRSEQERGVGQDVGADHPLHVGE